MQYLMFDILNTYLYNFTQLSISFVAYTVNMQSINIFLLKILRKNVSFKENIFENVKWKCAGYNFLVFCC